MPHIVRTEFQTAAGEKKELQTPVDLNWNTLDLAINVAISSVIGFQGEHHRKVVASILEWTRIIVTIDNPLFEDYNRGDIIWAINELRRECPDRPITPLLIWEWLICAAERAG